jgi:uncharacterized membrane protein
MKYYFTKLIIEKTVDICKYQNEEVLSKPDKIKTNYNDYINSFRKNNKKP